MNEFDLVIRGGTVVNASDRVKADVGVRNGRIVALGERLSAGKKELDASGKLVMPGGVDSHCHIDQPQHRRRNAETFETATRSAACGGTTSVVCFAQQKGVSLLDSVAAYHARARSACIDYSFHIVINDPNDEIVGTELPKLIGEGHRSIKLFMTYASNRVDDGQILRILEVARRNQALVCVHAENHDAIMFMTEKLLSAGHKATKYHAWCKPTLVEREATYRMIALAELMDQPIQIFHVTCGEAAEEIRRAQQRGLKVFAETCPQYFVLTEDDLDRGVQEGAKYLCSPAPRTKAEQEALWGYVKSGTLGNVTSDHAPYNIGDPDGKFWAGDNAPFNSIANGVPGLETRMPILFHEGVVKGRIDLQEFVAITSTNAANCSACTRKRERFPSVLTRISWSGTQKRKSPSARPSCTTRLIIRHMKVWRSLAGRGQSPAAPWSGKMARISASRDWQISGTRALRLHYAARSLSDTV